MDAPHFSFWQHLIHPCTFSFKEGKDEEVLTFRQKVQIVALAALAGIASLFIACLCLARTGGAGKMMIKVMSGMMGVVTFYGLTAYHKIQVMSRFQKEEEELLLQPLEVAPQEESSKIQSLATFFKSTLHPALDRMIQKAADPNLCFIKSQTDLFPTWFQNEYKGDSKQKNNLLYFKHQCPEIEQGVFVSIRGDGDCTYRSIGAGLMLQAILEEPSPQLEKLVEPFQRIASNLKKQACDVSTIIREMQSHVNDLKDQAQRSEEALQHHPEAYRLSNGYLNEDAQKMKATLDEKREVAAILENHLHLLSQVENQKQIQNQIGQLDVTVESLIRLFSTHLKKDTTSEARREKMIELLELEEFDQFLIGFLRNASALNLLLNMEKMDLYIKQLSNQEQVILGELSIFELICQRANARQPNLVHLQGSINDALSLSMLFEQLISWYRCEVAYEPEERSVYSFGKENKSQNKKHFYILNRPGHSDLILV